MSSGCDLVISVQLTDHDTTIEAFIANSDNVIVAKNFALRDYEAVFVCVALRVGNASCQACNQEVSQTLGLYKR